MGTFICFNYLKYSFRICFMLPFLSQNMNCLFNYTTFLNNKQIYTIVCRSWFIIKILGFDFSKPRIFVGEGGIRTIESLLLCHFY